MDSFIHKLHVAEYFFCYCYYGNRLTHQATTLHVVLTYMKCEISLMQYFSIVLYFWYCSDNTKIAWLQTREEVGVNAVVSQDVFAQHLCVAVNGRR